jgi:hypothetical protein
MRRPTAPAARLKKTALAEALRIGLVEEIQNLLGAEAIEALDFEALGNGRCAIDLCRSPHGHWNSGSTGTPPTPSAVRSTPAPAAKWRVMWTAAPSAFKPFSAI